MTTTDTGNRSTEQYRAALTAKLEAWVTHLPPQEQELLTHALNRVAANREDVHGYGGAGGAVTLRSGALVELVTTFVPPHDASPGSALDLMPSRGKPGIVKRGIDVPGGGPSVSGGSDEGDAGAARRGHGSCGPTWN